MDEVSGLEQLESIINFEKLTEWTSIPFWCSRAPSGACS